MKPRPDLMAAARNRACRRVLQAYLRNPAHEQLGARFGESLSAAWVYDFEVGGLDALRAGGLT